MIRQGVSGFVSGKGIFSKAYADEISTVGTAPDFVYDAHGSVG